MNVSWKVPLPWGHLAVQRQSEKDLRRYAVEPQAGKVAEAEFPVVIGMAEEATPFRIPLLQLQQPFQVEFAADAPTLMRRQDRDRAEALPIPGSVGNRHGREGVMPLHLAVQFGDKR
jgi:hypothetical protein